MHNFEHADAGSKGPGLVTLAACRLVLAGLILASLTACISTGPANRHPVYGKVMRVIDATADPSALEPCLANRMAEINEGKRFVAIRYRRWASHFGSTVYAEIPAGVTLQVRQELEIEPAACSKNQLAVILRPMSP